LREIERVGYGQENASFRFLPRDLKKPTDGNPGGGSREMPGQHGANARKLPEVSRLGRTEQQQRIE